MGAPDPDLMWLFRFENEACLNLGGPIGCEEGESADWGRLLRWGGEPMEPLVPFGDNGERVEAPFPNLKGGHSTRAGLRERALVVKPLVRDKEGRKRFGRRRLGWKLERSVH